MSDKSNVYSNQLKKMEGSEFVGITVRSLLELSKLGIPRTDQELTQRIDEYFQHCIQNNSRPGIESLCLSLSTTRQSFWNWCNGSGGKSMEWQHQCLLARQVIISFLESAGLSGKLNPATNIFLLKNWAGYADTNNVEIEEKEKTYYSAMDLPIFCDDTKDNEVGYETKDML